jgi:hypothetical protein
VAFTAFRQRGDRQMMKGLTKAHSVSTLNLMLLRVATALLSHAASTTN